MHSWPVIVVCLGPFLSYARGESAGAEPFDYFSNSWAVVGLKDYPHAARITPENKLMIGTPAGTSEKEADKATVQIRFGDSLSPLGPQHTKRLMDGWLPIVLISAQDGAVHYEFACWATPLTTVKDWPRAFDWPAESDNFLTWMKVEARNRGPTSAAARIAFEQTGPYSPDNHPVPMLARPREFGWVLPPEGTEECVLAIPWKPAETQEEFSPETGQIWLNRALQFWRELTGQAIFLDVPCRKAKEAYMASLLYQLIISDRGELRGGEGFYDEFYIRDGAYQLMQLEEAGLWQSAQKAVEAFLTHQLPDGRFESQKGQLDANGQALWALWQYYAMSDDRPWLEKAYPQMCRASEWIAQARRHAPSESPFVGLLPAALADGEFLWDGTHHIVGYDFWNLRGLLCTASAAQALGNLEEAEKWDSEAASYRAAIDQAWKQTGLPYFPPSWEKDGTHWGNTETLWPTELFPYDDSRVSALIEEVRERHGGGFFEGTIRWLGGTTAKPRPPESDAIHPYLSAYTTQALLIRGEHEKVVEDFCWYLLHSTATHGFPEGILHKRRFAWSNTIPHATGAANYGLLLRHMLIHERGDELHLLRAVPDWWLDSGKTIRVERAPTHFGVMSMRIVGTPSGVQVALDRPTRRPPQRIILHLPHSRPLETPLENVEVITRPDQKKRWDFPAIIQLYREHQETITRP